jgi:hypothetical protein
MTHASDCRYQYRLAMTVVMWTLIVLAVAVLLGFAIFIVRNEIRERKREIELRRPADAFKDPNQFS